MCSNLLRTKSLIQLENEFQNMYVPSSEYLLLRVLTETITL